MSNIQIVQQQIELAKPDFETAVLENNLNLNFQKEAAFAIQIFQGNDYLSKMNQDSIRNAIINVALTGLTLNPVMKFAYLVPRKGKCCLDPSYMGLVKILTDTGSVKNIEAKPVYSNEPFEIEQGTNPFVKHGIAPTQEKGHMIGVYSIATLNDGSKSVEWMYKQDVDVIAMRSEGVKSGKQSPWHSDYFEMARKTVVKRHYKYLPKSERAILAATAIDIDHENNGIDFKSENNKPDVLNIDTIDPNNQNEVSDLEQMLGFISNPKVPDNEFHPQTKEQFVESFRNELYSGVLTREFANKVYSDILAYAK